jgi:hypothetical protein
VVALLKLFIYGLALHNASVKVVNEASISSVMMHADEFFSRPVFNSSRTHLSRQRAKPVYLPMMHADEFFRRK